MLPGQAATRPIALSYNTWRGAAAFLGPACDLLRPYWGLPQDKFLRNYRGKLDGGLCQGRNSYTILLHDPPTNSSVEFKVFDLPLSQTKATCVASFPVSLLV